VPEIIRPAADEADALTPDELAVVFSSHRNFLATVFDEDLWYMQRKIADELDAHDRVAVKACHASGKTRLSAGIGASFLARHPDSIVISTAPTNNQVERQLWGEVHGLVRRARYVKFPDPLQTALNIGPQHYFAGFSTNDTTKFAGFHAPFMLFIVDEAPGVEDAIYDAIEGNAAGGRVKILLLGNPVFGGGKFHHIFTRERRFWRLHTISAFDTPNLAGCSFDNGDPEQRIAMRLPPPDGHAPLNLADVTEREDPRLDYNPRPYLTNRRWVWERLQEWGVLSAPFQARVLGRFPADDPDALIALGLIEDAEAPRPTSADDALDIGIDVAGPGKNNTVMYSLLGDNVFRVRRWPHGNCEGAVVAAVRHDEQAAGRRARHVGIDTAGLGHFFANTVAAAGIKVTRINVAHAPVGREVGPSGRRMAAALIYDDQKAQRYYRLRARFRARTLGNLTDDETIAQLTTLRVVYTPKGKIAMQDKRAMVRRGLPSPDEAEALMLAQHCPDLDRDLGSVSGALPGSVSMAG
jgi:phage terminase large subunit